MFGLSTTLIAAIAVVVLLALLVLLLLLNARQKRANSRPVRTPSALDASAGRRAPVRTPVLGQSAPAAVAGFSSPKADPPREEPEPRPQLATFPEESSDAASKQDADGVIGTEAALTRGADATPSEPVAAPRAAQPSGSALKWTNGPAEYLLPSDAPESAAPVAPTLEPPMAAPAPRRFAASRSGGISGQLPPGQPRRAH